MEPHDPYSHIHKRAKTDTRDDSEGGRQVNTETDGTKHSNEGDNKCDTKRRRPEGDVGFERLTRNPDCEADGADHKRMKLPDGETPNTDIEGDQELETNMAERMYQDDFKWNLDHVEDMCEDEATELKQTMADYAYYTWEELDPNQVEKGDKDEFERFCKMGVYEYVSRAEAEKDETGKFVKVKWVRTKKEDGVRCRLVAQGLGYGERLDELFAETPSLASVRMALTHAMKKDTHKVMVMDVKCAFLYGEIQRSVYIELPHTDPLYGDGTLVGK